MLIYLNAALVSWQTVNRRFPDASRLGSLVAAFVGIVIWVFGRKRKARFEANARIPLDVPAKALPPTKNMREEPP